jgi:hypothetical protein
MALPRFLRCWLLPTLSPCPPGSAEPRVAELGAAGLDKWGKERLDCSFGVRAVFMFSNMLWSTMKKKGRKRKAFEERGVGLWIISLGFFFFYTTPITCNLIRLWKHSRRS